MNEVQILQFFSASNVFSYSYDTHSTFFTVFFCGDIVPEENLLCFHFYVSEN